MAGPQFQLANVRFIKRIVVGNDNPQDMKTEAEVRQAMELVNKCISTSPRGTILHIEKSFGLYNIGEHQVVLQYAVYHLGFDRKPLWLDEHG